MADDIVISGDPQEPGRELSSICANLFAKGQLLDMTLATSDGSQIQAHKVVLASASPYLYKLLTSTSWPTPCAHPLILLKGSAQLEHLQMALEFVYNGEIRTNKSTLPVLKALADELGLNSLGRAVEAVEGAQNPPVSRTTTIKSRSSHSSPPPLNPIAIKYEDYNQQALPLTINPSPPPSNNRKSINNLVQLLKNANNGNGKPKGVKRSASETPSPPSIHGEDDRNSKDPRIVDYSMPNESKGHYNNNNNEEEYEDEEGEDLDKGGESFVYTNEGLGMPLSLSDGDNEDEDGFDEGTEPTAEMILNSLRNKGIKSEDNDPTSCPWCLQVFPNISLLQKHVKSHIGAPNYRPFSCEYCHTSFARSAHLKRHQRIHTGEKPFECHICKKAFARQDKLKVHLVRHSENNEGTDQLPSTNKKSKVNSIVSSSSMTITPNGGGERTSAVPKAIPLSILLPTACIKSEPSNNTTTSNGNGLTISKSLGYPGSSIFSSSSSSSTFATVTPIPLTTSPSRRFPKQGMNFI